MKPSLTLLSALIFSQAAFGAAKNYDDGLFSPFSDLSALSATEYTTLRHPVFPKHSVRVKRTTDWCDTTVGAYTGYIDVEAKHFFFYFFESRNDPSNDDVIFWTNGGPGCSSSLGLFMELGPCRITDGNGTKFHQQSWNSNANIFFIDQPVGVGFSYAEYGEHVSTTEEAAEDIASFVYVFFEHFTQFKGRPFHLAGESYAGRYLPVFAAYIYDQNKKLEKAGVAPINLTSVMIGNGYTHFPSMVESYYDMSCTSASVAPRLGVRDCVRMKQAQIRCKEWLKKSCVDVFDEFGCQAAESFCNSELSEPLESSGWNPYDISRKCDGSVETTLCYPVTKHISHYLDRPEVRNLIGVDPVLSSHNFSSCSNRVSTDFIYKLDSLQLSHHYVASLLEHGVRVLVYVGVNDWICNHVGNLKWVLDLDWSGKEGFARQHDAIWGPPKPKLEEEEMSRPTRSPKHGGFGKYRSYGGLTFATINDAGHMVPWDQPDASLVLLENWLAKKASW
ncbi:carboxypeptidase Y [Coprinopsis marcescibilis]|uniref:Carboxypeptidase n=1 Tax=Coprinopsis marcescibilis TaxID=230819 RepID=A0A5C3L5X7_COPMA|nr:carboxypeptidase Y [Coprinopsis marcescibilis]